jgi:hypothetical protein
MRNAMRNATQRSFVRSLVRSLVRTHPESPRITILSVFLRPECGVVMTVVADGRVAAVSSIGSQGSSLLSLSLLFSVCRRGHRCCKNTSDETKRDGKIRQRRFGFSLDTSSLTILLLPMNAHSVFSSTQCKTREHAGVCARHRTARNGAPNSFRVAISTTHSSSNAVPMG